MISIIIPVYNTELYLNKCLDSILSQTYSDLEVIAVNDGSTDGSGDILDDYAKKEPRLRVFHQSNAGVVAARNVGITAAKGEWLMFVDSDDYLPINAVELLYCAAVDSNADISVGKFQNVSHTGTLSKETTIIDISNGTQKEYARWLLTEKISFSLWAKLFRTSLFEGITHAPNLKIGEDGYIVIQLFGKAEKVSYVDLIVYCYLQHECSTMHKPSRTAVASRLAFVECVLNYYSDTLYSKDSLFIHCLHRFVMNELFGYFLMNGAYKDIPKPMIQILKICLKDKKAIAMLPLQRNIVMKAYSVNRHIGYHLIKLYKTLKRFI